jgi:hypothetical protein
VREHPLAAAAAADDARARRPRALEALVLACLSKEPGRRPANAGEVLATLETVAPLDEWTPADARAWWERYRAGGPAIA